MAIRRRDVLIGSLALAQLAASKKALAQAPKTRAAIVIGVNKSGNLPVLKAAASGAKSVADWLEGEDFEVKPFVDDNDQLVTAAAIKRTVFELVERDTLEQLVIYFSGHGIATGFNEYWLLSGAPKDLDEAISVVASFELAHRTGIKNVVFISDACRSIPEFNASQMNGSLIFPGDGVRGSVDPEVDRFLASSPGAPSFEAKLAADNYAGIYTATFLDAFRNPRQGMVETIGTKQVIPNSKLKDFLTNEVPRRLSAISNDRTQNPDSRLESRSFIGRALASPVSASAAGGATTTVLELASHKLNLSTIGAIGSLLPTDREVLAKVATDTGFDAAQKSVLEAPHPASFETQTGFAVNGASVKAVVMAGQPGGQILSSRPVDPATGRGGPALVRIPQIDRPVTVGLRFEDGSGTVLAALPGFIGTLTVEKGLVVSVSYLPSRNGSRWSEYGANAKRLDELRAVVAASARYGAFRIEGSKNERVEAAGRLANQMQVSAASLDPTLALYAAYAFADANLPQQVQSVRSIMHDDLNGDLFDLALLAGGLSGKRIGYENVAPLFCPMLTQGWQLLRVKNVVLPDLVELARADLRETLWTSFGPRGMELMLNAIQSIAPSKNAS